MTNIFLSASIPDPRRDVRYYESADVISIRDAVRALATVVLPHATLYWGGHPAITPLIRAVVDSNGFTDANRVRLYQSRWHEKEFPDDNAAFEAVEFTPKLATREDSDAEMRRQMITEPDFDFGIFVGGMEGVETEFELFHRHQEDARVLPVASTGGAARMIYERKRTELDLPIELATSYAYPTLFRRLLGLSPRGGV